MKSRIALALGLLTCLVAAPAAYAHHSFAAEFDGSKPTRLVGKITRVEWTNPHSYFYVDVIDAKDKWPTGMRRRGPWRPEPRGWKKGDLKIATQSLSMAIAQGWFQSCRRAQVTSRMGALSTAAAQGMASGRQRTDQGALPTAPAK